MFKIPILLLVWRRPQALLQVINSLRPLGPLNLYVACDGPSTLIGEEADKVNSVRELIERQIDWSCNIRRFYSDYNQGCALGVSRAISWFFDQVEEGIILEDDCVAHPDFFIYCAELLDRYRYDTRVWSISGNNFQRGLWRGDGSYYFSRYSHCWGWATWKRCWQHYDHALIYLPTLQASGFLNLLFDDAIERKYWSNIWRNLADKNKPDSWAYRWTFACMINGGLTALPNSNLINNIGFGCDATHTKSKTCYSSQVTSIIPLQHPTFVLREIDADRFTFYNHFGGKWAHPLFACARSLLRLSSLPLKVFVRH